ncbi:MAG: hypothetical protein OXB93_00995 [Cytophagales bacterium]|nr:hypothetical protein [Cytophagales bacterium]
MIQKAKPKKNTWYCIPIFCLLVLILNTHKVYSQLPYNLQWKELNNQHFKIVFPADYSEEKSIRLLNMLEKLRGSYAYIYGFSNTKKFPILINNRSLLSNAFVTLAPYRSEFISFPFQGVLGLTGNVPWMNLLALHEYRHVTQINQLKEKWNSFFYLLGGDNYLAASTLATPGWLFEGDAILAETLFSKGGRGRLPSFTMQHKANLLEYGVYPYGTRSDKYIIPPVNHYVRGYFLVNYLRKKFGTAKTNRLFQPFAIPIYTFSSKNYKTFSDEYRLAMEYFRSQFVDQINSIYISPYKPIKVKPRTKDPITHYKYPMPLPEGEILALKSGFEQIPVFVKINPINGKEQKIHVPGAVMETEYISHSGEQWVWIEHFLEGRWSQNITYGNIKIGNWKTKKVRTIGPKGSRYASASLSKDGKKIVAVEALLSGDYQLVILSAKDGSVLKKFKPLSDVFYTTPSFTEEDSKILVAKHQQISGERNIVLKDIDSESEEILLQHNDKEVVSQPYIYQAYLLYTSTYSGIDNIYALDLNTMKKYQVVSAKYGAFNPQLSSDGQNLIYTDFQVNGHKLVSIPFKPRSWRALEKVPLNHVEIFEYQYEPKADSLILNNISPREQETQYQIQPYSRKSNLFQVHSWGIYPAELRPTLINNSLSLAVQSSNLLQTTFAETGVDTYRNQKYNLWDMGLYSQIIYTAFPVQMGADLRYDSLLFHRRGGKPNLGVGIFARVPLNYKHGRYLNSYIFSSYIQLAGLNADARYKGYRLFLPMAWSRSYPRARREIYPRWKQSLSLLHLLEEGQNRIPLSTLSTLELYFPSLPTHSIHFSVESLRLFGTNEGKFSALGLAPQGFDSNIPGINQELSHRIVLRSNYSLPLLHMGWDAAIVYFQRLTAQMFFDYGWNDIGNDDIHIPSDYSRIFSTGVIFRLETNLFSGPNLRFIYGLGLYYRSVRPHYGYLGYIAR